MNCNSSEEKYGFITDYFPCKGLVKKKKMGSNCILFNHFGIPSESSVWYLFPAQCHTRPFCMQQCNHLPHAVAVSPSRKQVSLIDRDYCLDGGNTI